MTPPHQQQEQSDNSINLESISRILLRIVAQLPKNEYSGLKSNGQYRRQVEEIGLNDLPNPASAEDTSQG